MQGKSQLDPYGLALKWLATRELTEVQIRQRLRARQFSSDLIDQTVLKLRDAGALDDRRTAVALARTHALVKRHGRHRVLRELEAAGIDRELARETVLEIFEDIDERDLMERALSTRTGRGVRSIHDRAEYRRLFSYLVRQGFETGAVATLLRSRARGAAKPDEQ